MSRKPQTPQTADGTDDEIRHPLNRPAGRRFSGDESHLRIERELVADGVVLKNRAIPLSDHAEHGDTLTDEEIRQRINEEAERDVPNKNRIAYLNERLQASDE